MEEEEAIIYHIIRFDGSAGELKIRKSIIIIFDLNYLFLGPHVAIKNQNLTKNEIISLLRFLSKHN